MDVEVLDRVSENHPDVTKKNVEYAFKRYRHLTPRFSKEPTQYMAVGFDDTGRALEMLAFIDYREREEGSGDGHNNRHETYIVFHAMQCTKKFLSEMNVGKWETQYILGGNQHGISRQKRERHFHGFH
ncbi:MULTISPECIES: hypothetical protein [unclassified Bifidobacterium]|uniref:hypothetical protein n=1 Tax=unclassified Bifidobacterium TaxID=2608897 RepID=UPI0023F86099|nr:MULTISPECIES: hypothetical protein [unclassified Bifidobacterium]WEV66016.1 hypothetical protein OZX71_01265 [Bifidobacterium sp. ESL0764]WEV75193.1 hypothetical protein OZX75_05990 [Bifidobacterium sp. ESL0800]